MTTAIAPAPAETATTSGDDLNHIYCCDPDVALCGTDTSGHEFTDLDEADCLVCVDLEKTGCPCTSCGHGTEVTP